MSHEISEGSEEPTRESTEYHQGKLYKSLQAPEDIAEVRLGVEQSDFPYTGAQVDAILEEAARQHYTELVPIDDVETVNGNVAEKDVGVIYLNTHELPLHLFEMENWKPRRAMERGWLMQSFDLHASDIDRLLDSPKGQAIVQDKIDKSIKAEKARIKDQAWWLVMDNPQCYVESPFKKPIREQISFSNGSDEVTLHNVSEELTDSEVADIQHALHALDVATHGLVFKVLSNIVVHEDFEERYFKVAGKEGIPDGVAHSGWGLMTLDRQAIKGRVEARGNEGRENESALTMLIYHEAAHLLDEYLKRLIGKGDTRIQSVFERFFTYEDQEEDPRQKIAPRTTAVLFADGQYRDVPLTDAHNPDIVAVSKPTVDYGFTNSKEDLATALEYLFFGATTSLDPLRRDALIQILQYAAAAGGLEHEGKYVSRDSVNNIINTQSAAPDQQPLVAEPLQYYQEDGEQRVRSASPEISVQRREGDEVKYPLNQDAIDRLASTTRSIVRVTTHKY